MKTYGLAIVARSMSEATRGSGKGFANGNSWQYHPRSDRHSKVACWAIFFDLMLRDSLLSRHVSAGKVAFGINHRMRDFQHDREKDLDLVVCKRSQPRSIGAISRFADMVAAYTVVLSPEEETLLRGLVDIPVTGVQTALIALEAKAAMTEFGKARPRLSDELNSSHLTIHGDTDSTIAAGFAMVNAAPAFVSPIRNPWKLGSRPTVINSHRQPQDVAAAVEKVKQLPRRSKTGANGFDALGLAVICCTNDGEEVTVETKAPAPLVGCAVNYVTLAWLGRQRRVSSQGPPSTRTALRVDHCGPR